MLNRTLIPAGTGIALLLAVPAAAHRVEPIRFELAPSGNGAQTTLIVTNTRSFPITIEAVPSELAIDVNGAETLIPADDDFLIFPPQAVIEPGKVQSFRVRYLGDPALDHSKAYRIGVNQLPVDMTEEGSSGVAVTVNFATLANVVPQGARSALSVESLVETADGKWMIVVVNSGTRFARLSETDIQLRQGDQERTVRSSETQGWYDHNLVLPGNRLIVTMPAQEGFDASSTAITLVAPN